MRHPLPHVEMHVSHACNLRCQYCSHYCDFGYGGVVKHEEGAEWLRHWAERIEPGSFHLMGGEPLLNPELDKFIVTLAECFPDAKRAVVSNGLLLRNAEKIFPLLIETGTRLHVSLHPVTRAQAKELRRAVRYADSWLPKGLLMYVRKSAWKWATSYQGTGTAIRPFADGQPEVSLSRCSRCANLHQGKLWKCPQLAFLPLIFEALEHKEEWRPYLGYEPLSPDASDEQLAEFAAGEPGFCGMCPTEMHTVDLAELVREDPNLTTVNDRKKLYRSVWRAWNRRRLRRRVV